MSCEYSIIKGENSLSVWIDIDQNFVEAEFFDALGDHSDLKILGAKVVHTCVGPAEIVQEVSTNIGRFTLSIHFEDIEAGVAISSDDEELMGLIESSLLKSDRFHLRP